MAIVTLSAALLDDLLYDTYHVLLERGTHVNTSRGPTRELTVVALELSNPLARLSRSEARSTVVSCVGELAWYLAGDESVEVIRYYLKAYDQEAVDGKVLGAYGPRLFGPPINQIGNLIELLRTRPQSRRAVIQLFNEKDLDRCAGDVPCTCTVQLLDRAGALDMVVYMRSNDAVRGLPHDVFCFTMLQELLARTLNLHLGRYCHLVGSLHYYMDQESTVRRFLDEGFQSTRFPMPPMPDGDPWQDIKYFLEAEAAIRMGKPIPEPTWDALPTYWQDLARILMAFSERRSGNLDRIEHLRDALVHPVYAPYVSAQLHRAREESLEK